MSTFTDNSHRWWKEAVVYQIYPASFASTDNASHPGWGTIQGIITKLDYLKELGVDVVWTSPIFESPQVDMGYDVSNYKDIDPRYGSLSDVDELILGLQQRGMKLMLDLVVNHTSDQHPWFLDARSSKESKYRNWYHWQPPKFDENGKRLPPNNWAMILGDANSAWTWDEKTQEYYLSLFTAEQVDLNWENPEVRAAVHDILDFWLQRGASGFRMDVINLISKVPGYPDAEVTDPSSKYQSGDKFYANGPRLHEYLRDINKDVLSKYDTITVGEMPWNDDEEEILRTVAEDRKELNMIFIFDLVNIDTAPNLPRFSLNDWDARDLQRMVTKWQTVIRAGGGWPSLFVENHVCLFYMRDLNLTNSRQDIPRSVTKFTDDSVQYRETGAKLLALMQTTLSGTLYVYQGEEIGMANAPPEWSPDEYVDIESINYWKKINDLYPGDANQLASAKHILQRKARDHARTPVQWDDSPNAGFCKENIKPWMRVNDDYKAVNAAAQRDDGSGNPSVLQFWQRGLANRKKHKDVFIYGTYELLDDEHQSIFAYRRASKDGAFVVILNFSGKEVEWEIPSKAKVETWVTGNYSVEAPAKAVHGVIKLQPWEGILGTAKP